MNYYIQGDAAKAQQIKAAFKSKGYDISWPGGCANPDVINIGVERNGAKYVVAETYEYIKDIIKTHPDYKELELHVEPLFKLGDWVAYNENKSSITPMQIIRITEDKYIVSGHWSYGFRTLEADWHLWSIADAKDGDVLVNDAGCIFINAGFEKNDKVTLDCYCYVSVQGIFCKEDHKTGSWLYASHVHPATKEQSDLLFAKMCEAGYLWDAGKKELKKIQPHYDIANFSAGMPVLQRSGNDEHWDYDIFSRYLDNNCSHPFILVGCSSRQCIPYNDETKHLLGTTDPCDEQYINW